MDIEVVAAQLDALGNQTRLELYRRLVRAGEAGLSVGRLQAALDIPASTLSHHLRRLVDRGLATQERQATSLICRADYRAMRALIGFLSDECCSDGPAVDLTEHASV